MPEKILFILYNLLQWLLLVCSLPFIIPVILTSEKRRATVLQRLGFQSFQAVKQNAMNTIWIHALSVGEVNSAVPLVKKIRSTYPKHIIIMTASTQTGYATALNALEQDTNAILYFPYDILWAVLKMIKIINPIIFILVESDIWPNILMELNRRHVPTVLVNGRLSPDSFRGYRKASIFLKIIFRCFSLACVQSHEEAERFITIGMPDKKIQIVGNIKFDRLVHVISDQKLSQLRHSLGISDTTQIIIAGSTHPGEEDLIIQAFKQIIQIVPDCKLIIAPRDPKRAKEIACQYQKDQFGIECFSTQTNKDYSVLIIDKMGILNDLYAISTLAFVGGSLVSCGGHNPLEPASFGKPILFGPDMSDFPQISDMLLTEKAAIRVTSIEDLYENIKHLLLHKTMQKNMGQNAFSVFNKNQGAVDRTIQHISRLLN